jgi:hypothetical protein
MVRSPAIDLEEKFVVQRILRPFLLLAVLVAAMAGLVACGGGDEGGGGSGGGEAVSEGTDVNQVLDKAFASNQSIDKGNLSVDLKATATGDGGGDIAFTFGGPFESQGETKLPKFDWDVSFSGQGQNIKAGAEHTGTKAFVNFNGTEYAVDDATYKQFVQGYESSVQQGQQQGAGSLQDLGIDPKSWLKDPQNAGDSEVEGTETVKITGDVDVPKMLADVNTLIQKAGSLGLSGQANVPDQLTDEQIKQAEEAIKDLSLEIEAAKSDSSLRRVFLTINAENPDDTAEKIDGTLEIKLSDVGETQEFPEPSGAKPLQELLGQFGGLGGLGGAGASGSGSSSGSSSASQEKLEQYTQCIEDAGSDSAKAAECQQLLG